MWWLFIGIVLGAGFCLLWQNLRKNNIKLYWYEWLLIIVGVMLLLLNIDTFINSLLELEARAANMSFLFTGLPGAILILLCRGLVLYRQKPRTKGSHIASQ